LLVTYEPLGPAGPPRCVVCEAMDLRDVSPKMAGWGAPDFLCSTHGKEYWGRRDKLPKWLVYLENYELRRRRRGTKAFNLATDMNESDVGAGATFVFDDWQDTATDGEIGNAMDQVTLAELIGSAHLDSREISLVILRSALEWSWPMVVTAGVCGSQTSARRAYQSALGKMRAVAGRSSDL